MVSIAACAALAVHAQTPIPDLAWGRDGRAWHVFLTRYPETGPATFYLGRLWPAPDQRAPLARLGPFTLAAASAGACGRDLLVELTWRLEGRPSELPATASIFVHALDESGAPLGQLDGLPLGPPPSLLPDQPGLQLTDRRLLAAPGAATLNVGVYDYTTGERFPAAAPSGEPLPEDSYPFRAGACSSE